MKPKVHGHRGARALYPENTLPGFAYAMECGVDVLELDLAVTRDDILVVSHDPLINPALCDGPVDSPRVIREMTLAQLRAWDCGARVNPAFPRQKALPGTLVPTFVEVLDLADRKNVDLNVETKIFAARPELTPDPAKFAHMIYDAVAARGLESRLILQSFDFRTLAAMRRIDSTIRLSALFEAEASGIVAAALATGANIVSPHLSLATREMVRQAHDAGLEVVPWTANTPQQWSALINAEVDGIITDDPQALIAFLNGS